MTALSRHFRVHALDLLGHGLTSGCEVAPKRKDYVSHLLGYMDQEGIDRAHLVGESLGGWIAAWTALEHPDRVDRLIYVCGARLTLEVGADAEARTAAGRAELARSPGNSWLTRVRRMCGRGWPGFSTTLTAT
ncbi:alpha/beta fold hydrolase [Mycolicibacterium sp. SCSIO 43805]|uniref:alpha/beta fold hydrolase n=1 Tax=Mycolicibacterium sp. SCSIO 43805 TaxID=3378074 RepID=UPI003AB4906F